MSSLTILWTTDNEITIKNMLFMYARNAKIMGWFEEVKVIIWGASTKKLVESISLQNELKEVVSAGVEFVACLACSDNLGTTEKLAQLGIDVEYVGEELSEILKGDEKVLTI